MAYRARLETLRRVTGTALTGNYQDLGAVLTGNAEIVILATDCDKPILVSFDDGTTDHFRLPGTSSVVLDLRTNNLQLAGGLQVQVKHDGSAPTSGVVTMTVIYATYPTI